MVNSEVNYFTLFSFLVYLLCPIKTNSSVITSTRLSNNSNSPTNPLFVNHETWILSVLKDEDNVVNTIGDSEPGFDLTEQEMVKFKIWPDGIIPFYIDDLSFDKVLKDRIRHYLDTANKNTGLRFMEIPLPFDDKSTRYVFFINRRGKLDCVDYNTDSFTNKGVQKVVLGYDCLITGGPIAKVVLALAGVPPQHRAPNRDEYITVQTVNMLEGKEHLFSRLSDTDWLFHDVKYDYKSAGHYPWMQYTKNGMTTMKPHYSVSIGEISGLSYHDIWKVRMLYNYIKQKQKSLQKLPECAKLYVPGSNLSAYEPEVGNDNISRPKPNKYLGIEELNLPDNKDSENEEDQVENAQENDRSTNNNKNNNKLNNQTSESLENINSQAIPNDNQFQTTKSPNKKSHDDLNHDNPIYNDGVSDAKNNKLLLNMNPEYELLHLRHPGGKENPFDRIFNH